MKLTWGGVSKILKNKFFITGMVFFLWLAFFDNNNLLDRYSNLNYLKRLEKEKSYFSDLKKQDSIRLQELMTNDKNLEKFAREQYLMKKDNEDIFIIMEEN